MNGPPGAGKTTVVSSYIEFRNLRCLWYQIDPGDEDVATFFHYFSQAAREHLSVGTASLPHFNPEMASGLTRFSRQYFREFYGGLGTPCVVVLDNYQELAGESPLHEVARVACEETPENCHIVVVGRERCPKALARMHITRALTVIDAEDLALKPEETHGIAELQGVKLPSIAAAIALQTRSAGWVTGLVLMLERHGRTDAGLSLRDKPEEAVFDYFEGEVFRKLDPHDVDLLLQSALLPKMTAHRLTQLTGTSTGGALLHELMRRNYFITRHVGELPVYQFHPLFRQFLLNQAVGRYPAPELSSLRRKAAEVLISDCAYEDAIELLEQARDWQRMAEVILATALTLRAQGRTATLDGWVAKLPADVIHANPWLLYWHGTRKALSTAESQAILEDAYHRFSAADDLLGIALSWCSLVDAIFKVHRDLRRLDSWIAEFDQRLADRLDQLAPDVEARVTLGFFIALSFRQPVHPNMSLWLERVRKILESESLSTERAMLRQHLVMHHILRGEHPEAEANLGRLCYGDESPATAHPLRTLADHVSEARLAMQMGMGKRCLQAVSEGLRVAEESGNHVFDSVLLQLGSLMSLNRGELARADKFLAAFDRVAEALPFADRGDYFAVAAWRKFYSGESAFALQLLGRTAAASEARGAPYFIAADHLGCGLLFFLCGRTSEALRHLELGRKVGSSIKNPVFEYVYQLFSAYVAFGLHDEDKARDHLAIGMRLGCKHGYMHFLFFPPRVIARLCLIALESGIETLYVQSLIERNELTPDPAWGQAESWPWPIRIYTLGRFGVVKRGEPLRFAGKTQKKPLELLKALIAFGGREVSEHKLTDALWPDAEGDAAAQSLATTLFRLRKLLGEQVIRRQERRLTLDPSYCWVDCWAFQRLSSDDSGDRSMRVAKLRRLHQGPFLDGEDDAPWAKPHARTVARKVCSACWGGHQARPRVRIYWTDRRAMVN